MAVAIVLGIGTALVVYNYINKLKDEAKKDLKPVVVAIKEIKTSAVLAPDMVTLVERESVAANAATRLEDVVGKVALMPYRKDDQIRLTEISDKDKVPTLSYRIPEGKRALTLRIDEEKGVGGSILPGNFVDIMATYQDPVTGQKLSQIILQRMEVLAIDEVQMDSSSRGAKGAIKTVTLAVTPDEAQKITVTYDQGALRLMLRPENENKVFETEAVSLAHLIKPAVAPPGSEVVKEMPVGVPIGAPEPPKVRYFKGSETPKEVTVNE